MLDKYKYIFLQAGMNIWAPFIYILAAVYT